MRPTKIDPCLLHSPSQKQFLEVLAGVQLARVITVDDHPNNQLCRREPQNQAQAMGAQSQPEPGISKPWKRLFYPNRRNMAAQRLEFTWNSRAAAATACVWAGPLRSLSPPAYPPVAPPNQRHRLSVHRFPPDPYVGPLRRFAAGEQNPSDQSFGARTTDVRCERTSDSTSSVVQSA